MNSSNFSRITLFFTLFVSLIFANIRTSFAADHSISIIEQSFAPTELTIAPGDSVIWRNNDVMPHTVTATDGSFDSDFLAVGAEFGHRFPNGGTFAYYCQYHSNMSGAVVVGTSGGGDSSWVELLSPTTLPLNDVRFINAQIGWAAGDQGILRTTNGGDFWTLTNTPEDVEAVYFINESEGWACGNDGYMVHTTNGGESWTPQTSGVGEKIRDVWFSDANNGWAGGRDGLFIHTTDGGQNWNPQATPLPDDIQGIHFLDAQTGWICGQDGLVAHTSNGGADWEVQLNVPDGEEDDFDAIFMLDDEHGWVVGERGRIFHTHNGGASWFPLQSGTNLGLMDIHMATHDDGFMCGVGGYLAQAAAEGTMWLVQEPPAIVTFNSVFFVSANQGYLVTADGRIFRRGETLDAIDPTIALTPTAVTLAANYPNPFNPTTTLEFSVATPGFVSLEIFDILGRDVATVVNDHLIAGTYHVPFEASGLASGLYFYQLRTAGVVLTRTMTLVK